MWYAIVLAGGSGSRMGAACNKVLLPLQGERVITRSVRAFQGLVKGVVLVGRDEDMKDIREAVQDIDELDIRIVKGGATRQESVWNGLQALPEECSHVLIHDGARCLVDEGTIARCMQCAEAQGSGVAAIPAIDTIKRVNADDTVAETPDRSALRAVQTPQAFRLDIIRKAHQEAQFDGFTGTDDASLVERAGMPVHLTLGDRKNIKITTPEDMKMAEVYLGGGNFPTLRVGMGYDVHRLTEGCELILCGVNVPHTLGLLGHSDADVAVHALMDAMLGAVALGDIGRHFPDTDERYRGVSSMKLLEHVVALLMENRAHVTNCDVTIVAQKPKLLPYIQQMRRNLADAMDLPVERVNVKATTTERLAFEGREEGISAQAVCMVVQD